MVEQTQRNSKGKSIPVRWNSICKGSEEGLLGKLKDGNASVAGGQQVWGQSGGK